MLRRVVCLFVLDFRRHNVADETTEKDNTNKSELAKLDQAKKAARATLGKLNQKKKELEDQQNKMWLQAWSEQKDIFTWPTGYSNSNEFEEAKRMPFGAGGFHDKEKKELVDLDESRFDGIRKEFRDVYQPEFVKLANSLDPMQFAGGGLEAVLKTPKWTTVKPSSEDIWLALEDLWVEREFSVRSVKSIVPLPSLRPRRTCQAPSKAQFGRCN